MILYIPSSLQRRLEAHSPSAIAELLRRRWKKYYIYMYIYMYVIYIILYIIYFRIWYDTDIQSIFHSYIYLTLFCYHHVISEWEWCVWFGFTVPGNPQTSARRSAKLATRFQASWWHYPSKVRDGGSTSSLTRIVRNYSANESDRLTP